MTASVPKAIDITAPKTTCRVIAVPMVASARFLARMNRAFQATVALLMVGIGASTIYTSVVGVFDRLHDALARSATFYALNLAQARRRSSSHHGRWPWQNRVPRSLTRLYERRRSPHLMHRCMLLGCGLTERRTSKARTRRAGRPLNMLIDAAQFLSLRLVSSTSRTTLQDPRAMDGAARYREVGIATQAEHCGRAGLADRKTDRTPR